MRCRKICLFDRARWFESKVIKVFVKAVCVDPLIDHRCVCVHFIFSFHSVRSSKWTLAVRMLHHLCVYSLFSTVYRFVLRTCLGDAHDHRRDVESRRVNFILISIDDRSRCLSRKSAHQFECLPSLHVQLPNHRSDSRSDNEKRFSMFDYLFFNSSQSIPTIKSISQSRQTRKITVHHCLDSGNIVVIEFVERNLWNSLYMGTYSNSSRWDIERYSD